MSNIIIKTSCKAVSEIAKRCKQIAAKYGFVNTNELDIPQPSNFEGKAAYKVVYYKSETNLCTIFCSVEFEEKGKSQKITAKTRKPELNNYRLK